VSETEAISIKEYARRKGCSDTAVRKAIASGKIVKGVIDQKTARPKIIPSIADVEWSRNINPAYERVFKLKPEPKPRAPKKAAAVPTKNIVETRREISEQPLTPKGRSYHDIKTLQAEVKLQYEMLTLKEKKGELVDKKQVYRQLFEIGQQLKSGLLTLPDRVIDAIFSAPSRNDAHTVLTKAIIDELESISQFKNAQE
jgi:hypothetical protein